MKKYLLRYPITETDVDFLNATSIKFEIIDTHGLAALTEVNLDKSLHDSGWCDVATNARIINSRDRAVFQDVTPAQETLLQLKYHERLILLTGDELRIYNV